MILCIHCGYQNRDGSRFCTACGNRLSADHRTGSLRVLGDLQKREYTVSTSDRFIGRDPVNDLIIDDDEVSGRHAKIWFADDILWIEDLGTTNGTFVNGQRIEGPMGLRNDDLVKIGRTILQILT